MIFSTSLPRFKAFLADFSGKSSDWACSLLFITSFLLPTCRRSVAAAARSILHDIRDAGWLLRWLGGSTAPAALLAAAQNQLLHAARDRADRLHILAIDSTMHGQQGQHTQNTYSCRNTQKRPSKSDRHQKKFHRRSEHCFVFALLLTPNGLRIPYWLPFYTKQHCAIFGRKHYTQADLAAQLIDCLPLAAHAGGRRRRHRLRGQAGASGLRTPALAVGSAAQPRALSGRQAGATSQGPLVVWATQRTGFPPGVFPAGSG